MVEHTEHEVHSTESHREEAYETSDVSLRGLAIFGAGLVMLGLVLHVVFFYGAMPWFKRQQEKTRGLRSPLAEVRAPFEGPEPRLQAVPAEEMRRLRAHEDTILSQYALIDPEEGTVRIPIERAIELVAERGLPTPETTRPPASAPVRPPRAPETDDPDADPNG